MRRTLHVLVGGLLALAPLYAVAGVILGGTRVVYPERTREVTVSVSNPAAVPALIQAWVDAGDVNSTPETASTPFVVTPPLFRVEAGGAQILRIKKIGHPPATDRETVYWLNVLEIPPKVKEAASGGRLQFAIRTRIKVFYRPEGLPDSPDDAPGKLKAVSEQRGIRVENPTPYSVSYRGAIAKRSGGTIPVLTNQSGMIEPFTSALITIAPGQGAPGIIEFSVINDYGGLKEVAVPVSQ